MHVDAYNGVSKENKKYSPYPFAIKKIVRTFADHFAEKSKWIIYKYLFNKH